jgi:hypothetical protein
MIIIIFINPAQSVGFGLRVGGHLEESLSSDGASTSPASII